MARKQELPAAGSTKQPDHSADLLGAMIRPERMPALRGSDKSFALDQLVANAARALNLNAGQQLDLSAHVHAREASLNTQLGPGWAAPHATLELADDLVLVVGRSRAGIEWGRSGAGRVHLVFLFISSARNHDYYLRVLSQLAGAFRDSDSTQKLQRAARADTAAKLRRALVENGRQRIVVSRRLPSLTRALIRNFLRFADDVDAQPIILFADVFRNPSHLQSFVSEKIVLATRATDMPEALVSRSRGLVRLARGDFSTESAVQLALLSAGARGLLGGGSRVIAVCGEKGSDNFDTVRIEAPRALMSRVFGKGAREAIAPEIFERAVELMVELGEEGREGKPVGAIIMLGDEDAVREYSQQLTINPFRGYDEHERNLMDHALEETIKEFSRLDGAFVVSSKGIILSAGTYLSPPAEVRVDLVSGLGTRHRVAAAMTKATKSTALVLSQSSGRVTVFRGGKEVLAVSPSHRRVETAEPRE